MRQEQRRRHICIAVKTRRIICCQGELSISWDGARAHVYWKNSSISALVGGSQKGCDDPMSLQLSAQPPSRTRKRSPLVAWAPRHSLAAFLVLTFGYSGLLMLPVLASAQHWIPLQLAGLPALLLQLLAVWGPTFAAVALTGLISGRAGLRELLDRLLRWRVGVQWYAVVFLFWPVITLAALGLLVLLGGTIPATIQLSPWYAAPLAFLLNFPLFFFLGGPLGEEAGWRGFALPGLLTRHSAFSASLLVGMIWASWHLPLFWIPDTGSGSELADFGWFFLLLSAWGILLGWSTSIRVVSCSVCSFMRRGTR
jgi:membrane protease YdiL (CAAX protease family)